MHGEDQPKFRDAHGNWREDRRHGDRRKQQIPIDFPDRRQRSRRELDREFLERDHKQMIEEALEEFAAEHQRPHGQ